MIMNKWIYRILIGFCVLIFTVCAFFLGKYLYNSLSQKHQFTELSDLVEQEQASLSGDISDSESASSQTDWDSPLTQTLPDKYQTVTHPQTGEELEILQEYASVFLRNTDLVGWIKIEDTKINYPVMQTIHNPNYYLKRDFYGQYSEHGCIYVSEACDVNAPSDNLTIYGHRMKDGSMFFALQSYTDPEFYAAHPYILFDTLTEHHRYEILSVFLTTASVGEGFPYHTFVDAADEAEFDRFVATCKELALYDTGVDAAYGDKLITLSTCEYSQVNGRLVVVAKRIS